MMESRHSGSPSGSDSAKGKGTNRAGSDRDSRSPPRANAQDELGEHRDPVYSFPDDHCAICLAPLVAQSRISPCGHDQFCFLCITAWADKARRCPLCSANIHHLIFNYRSERDFQIHHLPPLSTKSSPPPPTTSLDASSSRVTPGIARHSLYGRREEPGSNWREREEERALERRRYVYREGLFAKHVASNRYTRFTAVTPESFSLNTALKSRVIRFVRRELQVFPNIDIAFLTTYLLSIATQMDLRSDSAISLLSDFLTPTTAVHFAHEVVSFARSPFVTLEGYDRCIQYGRPERLPDRESRRPEMGQRDRERRRPEGEERNTDREGEKRRRTNHRSRAPSTPPRSRSPLSRRSPAPDIPPPLEPIAPIEALNLSIFGAAKRATPVDPVPAPVPPEIDPPVPHPPKAVVEPAVPPKPQLDITARLQARLLDEYRASMAKKASPPPPPPSIPVPLKKSLRDRLADRLRVEKEGKLRSTLLSRGTMIKTGPVAPVVSLQDRLREKLLREKLSSI